MIRTQVPYRLKESGMVEWECSSISTPYRAPNGMVFVVGN